VGFGFGTSLLGLALGRLALEGGEGLPDFFLLLQLFPLVEMEALGHVLLVHLPCCDLRTSGLGLLT